MRCFLSILFFLAATSVLAQENLPESPRAVNARRTFLKAVSRATKQYKEELENALKVANSNNEMKEAERIKQSLSEIRVGIGELEDPLSKARRSLEGSVWTFESDGVRKELRLSENNEMKLGSRSGAWTILNGQSAAIFNMEDNIFILSFNENYTGFYILRAYGIVPTEFKRGSRLK